MENYTGNKLKELRSEKNMTQEELSEKSGINVRTIQRIESGEASPRGYTINLIADAISCSESVF